MKLQTTNYKLQTNEGFSLIELLVSIAILVIVSGLVFFNQSGFNNSVLVENLAYEISLTIRQAQSYGLQSKEFEKGSNLFTIGYGVYFNIDDNDKIILYADVDMNHLYDGGGGVDREVDVLRLTSGNVIEKLCVGDVCAGGEVNVLNVSFIRPNPESYINYNSIAGSGSDVGEIYIKSPKDERKKVIVNKIGQIAVE